FSSRRRHTRFSRDWSSDVCSSDLKLILQGICKVETQFPVLDYRVDFYLPEVNLVVEFDENDHKYGKRPEKDKQREKEIQQHLKRSEERRVGKERRSRRRTEKKKKK